MSEKESIVTLNAPYIINEYVFGEKQMKLLEFLVDQIEDEKEKADWKEAIRKAKVARQPNVL